jgi:hypothetical protein
MLHDGLSASDECEAAHRDCARPTSSLADAKDRLRNRGYVSFGHDLSGIEAFYAEHRQATGREPQHTPGARIVVNRYPAWWVVPWFPAGAVRTPLPDAHPPLAGPAFLALVVLAGRRDTDSRRIMGRLLARWALMRVRMPARKRTVSTM